MHAWTLGPMLDLHLPCPHFHCGGQELAFLRKYSFLFSRCVLIAVGEARLLCLLLLSFGDKFALQNPNKACPGQPMLLSALLFVAQMSTFLLQHFFCGTCPLASL